MTFRYLVRALEAIPVWMASASSDGALSLNKCYIDANFDIEFGKVEFTLDPKIPSVEIKEVFYRKEDADDYVMISSDANGAYAFPVDMGLPYLIKVDMTIDGLDRTLYYKVPTVFYPSYSFEEATQTSISFKLTSLFADILDGYGIHRSSIYYPADAEGNVVVDNLRPGNTYEFHTYGIYKGEIYSSPDEYVLPITTGQISPSISAEVSPTTIKATGSYIHGDATIINSGFEHNGEFSGEDSILITGLAPGYNYHLYYVVNTEEGGSYRVDKSITTSNLRLETGTAKPTSKTSVLLVAATNIDNAETNVGFQWRRHDAPEDMPSDYIKCPVSTICVGMAASMGSILLTCGEKGKRFATPNSEILIHQPLIGGNGLSGQTTDIKIHTDHLVKTREKMNKLLSEKTGQPIEKIMQDTERDNYMTAEEALKYGLIDEILEKRI